MDIYLEQIVDLAKNPLNKREIKEATLTHSGVNPTCGDHVRIYLKIDQDKDGKPITDASFEGEGCAISIASASLLTEELKDMPLQEAASLSRQTIFELLGTELGPARVKCGVLCLETLQGAIDNASKAQTKD